MNLLILIQCLNLGGMEQATRHLVRGLQERNVKIEVNSVTPAGDGRALFEEMGTPVKDYPYRGKFGWKTHHTLRKALRSVRTEIVLIAGATLTGCLAARRIDCREMFLVVHYHHYERSWDHWKWWLFYKIFGKDYKNIIFPTKFLKNEAEAIAPQLTDRMVVIPYPIRRMSHPSADEKATAKEKLGIPAGAVVVGNAGWLIPRKRFDVFLSVASRLQKEIPNCYFVIAGDGPLKSSLMKQAETLGLTHRVRFLGWQKSLAIFYSALDLLIFNTDADNGPMTPTEAMSYGVPVVASSVYGGTNEIVIDGETGYLLRDHDVEKLSRRAMDILRDGGLRNRMTRQAYKKLRQRNGIEAVVDQYMALFEE